MALALPIAATAANVALESAYPAIESPLLPFLALAYVTLRQPNFLAWVCLGATLLFAAAGETIPGLRHAPLSDVLADLAILAVAGALFIRLRIRLHEQESASASRTRDEAARFRNLLSSSPDGIWRVGPEGRTLDVNAPMAAMLGYSREEMIGRHFDSFFDEAGRSFAHAAFERGRKGEPMAFELSMRGKDGAEVRALCSTHSILDSTGRFLEGFGILHDITERYRGEQERHQALSLLEATLESTADGLLVVNVEGRIVRFNERFANLWRIPADILSSGDDERAIGFVLSQLEEPEQFVSKVRKLYATPGLESFDTLRFKDGRVFERYSMPQRLDGEIIGRVWSFRDVTDRERAAAEQRLAMEREASIAANLDAALFTCTLDADGNVARYDYLSRGAEALYGLPRETIETDPGFWATRVHSEDLANVVRPMLARLVRLQPAVIEVRYQSSRGIYRWHRSHLFPRREPDGSVHVDGIEADVTERVKLEDQLRHAQKMEAIGQLAGGVAHDFNNILTAVIGYSDLLLARMAPGDQHRHAVQEIRKGADRAAGLTRQLLAFGRRATTQPRLLDPNEAIRDLEPMLRRLLGEDVRFELSLSPSIGKIRIDPTHFEQVIVNLAVNARDAMPSGGTIRVRTESVERAEGPLEGPPSGRHARLVFSDDGVGIPPEVREHIFEPFFTTKEAGRGTGLGLATVYGIVRQHHGSIDVSSETGKGTSFEILLPEAAGGDSPEDLAAAPAAGGRERIVLVEDDAALLALSREILLELGYEVFPARSGAEALSILDRLGGRLDILVTDVVMPEIGGRELARRAQEQCPGLTVLYVSGYPGNAGPAVEEWGRESAFLAKPFTPLALARKVREMLDSRASRAARPSTSPPASRA
ncbi:MAG TPA: PAS domain S-box protein [Candidatus Eisenbacteria bacterium]|nr:PAS domain S-box protein [Candidatus Eisenbacteria bacterium]